MKNQLNVSLSAEGSEWSVANIVSTEIAIEKIEEEISQRENIIQRMKKLVKEYTE